MIVTFKKYTKDLTQDEVEYAREIFKLLLRTKQTKRPITNKQMCNQLKQAHGWNIDGPRMRKIINWIILRNHISKLIATSKGYKIAETKKELELYVQSLTERVGSIEARRDIAKMDLNNWNP